MIIAITAVEYMTMLVEMQYLTGMCDWSDLVSVCPYPKTSYKGECVFQSGEIQVHL